MDLREWGALLQQLRRDAGYPNAGAFAAEVGVSKRMVELWESGRNWPSSPRMAQLVRVLGPGIDPGAVAQLSRMEEKLDSVTALILGEIDELEALRRIAAAQRRAEQWQERSDETA